MRLQAVDLAVALPCKLCARACSRRGMQGCSQQSTPLLRAGLQSPRHARLLTAKHSSSARTYVGRCPVEDLDPCGEEGKRCANRAETLRKLPLLLTAPPALAAPPSAPSAQRGGRSRRGSRVRPSLISPDARTPRAQGSSGATATVPFVWRGHTKSRTTRAGRALELAVRLG